MQRQTILLIVLVVVLGGIGYIWYNYYKNSPAVTTAQPNGASSDIEVRLAQLRKLKTLQLDVSLLDDSLFKGLQIPSDTALSLQPVETKGRSNPFFAP